MELAPPQSHSDCPIELSADEDVVCYSSGSDVTKANVIGRWEAVGDCSSTRQSCKSRQDGDNKATVVTTDSGAAALIEVISFTTLSPLLSSLISAAGGSFCLFFTITQTPVWLFNSLPDWLVAINRNVTALFYSVTLSHTETAIITTSGFCLPRCSHFQATSKHNRKSSFLSALLVLVCPRMIHSRYKARFISSEAA